MDADLILGPGVVNSITRLLKINFVVVFFSKSDRYSKSTMYMEIKGFLVKKEIQKQRISIKYISTNLMITNPLIEG